MSRSHELYINSSSGSYSMRRHHSFQMTDKVMKTLCKTFENLITGRDPEVKKLRKALESHKTILNENKFFDFLEYK